MDVEKSIYQNGDEPELLHVNFPDFESQGRYIFRSPRSEWLQLAKEKGREHNIPFKAIETENGLTVAFLKSDDCNQLISSMAPDWHNRLMDGLKISLKMRALGCRGDGEPNRTNFVQEASTDYDLSANDMAELYAEWDERMRLKVDLDF